MSATNDALQNICTLYGYDDAGNQITTTNALNQTSLTVYDSANRPVLTVRNLVVSKAEGWNGTPTSNGLYASCKFVQSVAKQRQQRI